MAITQLQERPGIGEMLGTGLGSGLSSGLQQLAKHKMRQLSERQDRIRERQDRGNTFQSLVSSGVPEDVSSAIVDSPKGMQRELFKTLMRLRKSTTYKEGSSGGQDLYKLRKRFLSQAKKDGKKEAALKSELSTLGVSPQESEFLVGTKINDDAIRYFLSKTNNDPKKARQLAKKFGYKV